MARDGELEGKVALVTGGSRGLGREMVLAFAMFRYACMVQGVLHRYTIGTAANWHFAHSQERVVVLARKARDILEAKP